ncbi:hypothetical protein EON65_51490 [archaeon]|nr:MAG: hypothetical protein EON65_51490 [archaeon]
MGAVAPTLYPLALPLILAPLCYLLPRYVTYTLATTYTYAHTHGAPPTHLTPQQVKSRCVRVMVHAQNCLWGLLTSHTVSPTLSLPELAEIRRVMGDLLIGGVEGGRRLVQVVGSSKEDIKVRGIYVDNTWKVCILQLFVFLC